MKTLVAPILSALLLVACAQTPPAADAKVADATEAKCVVDEAPTGSNLRKRVPCRPVSDKEREAAQESLRRMQDSATATSKTY